jgi:hypothetical protein
MVLELFMARVTEGAQRIQEALPDRLPDSGECRVFVGVDSDDDTQSAVRRGNDFGRRQHAHPIERGINLDELCDCGRIVLQGVELQSRRVLNELLVQCLQRFLLAHPALFIRLPLLAQPRGGDRSDAADECPG